MNKLFKFLMPSSCRKDLLIAAKKNAEHCNNLKCMLKVHKDKIVYEISTPKYARKLNLPRKAGCP